MVTAQAFLRASLFALLLMAVHGSPVKGSKSQSQDRPINSSGDNVGSHQGSPTAYSAPVFYSTSGAVSKPVGRYLGPPQYVQAQPMPLALRSVVPGAGYTTGVGFVPVPAGSVAGYLTGASAPLPVGSFVPLQAGYAAISPQAGTWANMPAMVWVIAPRAVEEATANTQPQGLSIVGPPLPPGPLQSGETSNVAKEAKLGNYQQQMEFGYPSDRVGPGFPPVLPASGVGGLLGFPSPYPYPGFDYRLLYGLYPPGTFTTFSKNHEKGKDYQTIHSLKEHGSDAQQNPGSRQQQRL